jgi:hypothetical protein
MRGVLTQKTAEGGSHFTKIVAMARGRTGSAFLSVRYSHPGGWPRSHCNGLVATPAAIAFSGVMPRIDSGTDLSQTKQ